MARVLMINDRRNFAAAAAGILERAGHDVTVTESVIDAMACIRNADVVFLDLDMHALDGARLLEGMNLDGRLPTARIVALSDSPDPGASCRLYGLGVHRVLRRADLTPGDLLSLVGHAGPGSSPLAA